MKGSHPIRPPQFFQQRDVHCRQLHAAREELAAAHEALDEQREEQRAAEAALKGDLDETEAALHAARKELAAERRERQGLEERLRLLECADEPGEPATTERSRTAARAGRGAAMGAAPCAADGAASVASRLEQVASAE